MAAPSLQQMQRLLLPAEYSGQAGAFSEQFISQLEEQVGSLKLRSPADGENIPDNPQSEGNARAGKGKRGASAGKVLLALT
jgi:hypothetical protein